MQASLNHIKTVAVKNQTAINLVTNIAVMTISMAISLWMTPYLIRNLGIAAYGYVGVLNNIINFMTVITYMLTSMVGRFLIVSHKTKGWEEASRYVSSALYTNLLVGALLLPLAVLLANKLDGLLRIQTEYVIDVKTTFVLSSIAFICTSISQVFATGSYSINRLDIRNGILIVSHIVRLVSLVLMFSILGAHIWHVAFAAVLQALISVILAAISFRTLLPDVHFSIHLFDLHHSIELLSSGLMISIITLGNNFLTQIDLIVGNRFLQPEVVGMYAAVLLLPNSIRNIASALSSAFTPTTISLYSSGYMDELRRYSNRVVKFCGIMIGWPVGVIGGLALPILHIWLGKDYSDQEIIILLLLLPLTLQLAANQLFNVQQATNKVKIPAVMSICFGVMNVLLAVYFTASLGMELLGIVLSGLLTSTVRTTLFMPIYTAIITNQSRLAYYKGMIPPFLVSSAICGAGILLQKLVPLTTFSSILYSAVALSIVYSIFAIGLLSNEERGSLVRKVLEVIRSQRATL